MTIEEMKTFFDLNEDELGQLAGMDEEMLDTIANMIIDGKSLRKSALISNVSAYRAVCDNTHTIRAMNEFFRIDF